MLTKRVVIPLTAALTALTLAIGLVARADEPDPTRVRQTAAAQPNSRQISDFQAAFRSLPIIGSYDLGPARLDDAAAEADQMIEGRLAGIAEGERVVTTPPLPCAGTPDCPLPGAAITAEIVLEDATVTDLASGKRTHSAQLRLRVIAGDDAGGGTRAASKRAVEQLSLKAPIGMRIVALARVGDDGIPVEQGNGSSALVADDGTLFELQWLEEFTGSNMGEVETIDGLRQRVLAAG